MMDAGEKMWKFLWDLRQGKELVRAEKHLYRVEFHIASEN